MKKKDERMADLGLERLGIIPRIYHFVKDVGPFSAVTIAEDMLTWEGARRELDKVLKYHISKCLYNPAPLLIEKLRKKGVYGVAVGYKHDSLNRPLGRTIAKGRLLKHLKQEEVKNGK